MLFEEKRFVVEESSISRGVWREEVCCRGVVDVVESVWKKKDVMWSEGRRVLW